MKPLVQDPDNNDWGFPASRRGLGEGLKEEDILPFGMQR
jgi:hypothetical protein